MTHFTLIGITEFEKPVSAPTPGWREDKITIVLDKGSKECEQQLRKQRVSENTQFSYHILQRSCTEHTLKTGLGLEGREIQRTIACCPTRVVYSSSVAQVSWIENEKKVQPYAHRHKISFDLRQFI